MLHLQFKQMMLTCWLQIPVSKDSHKMPAVLIPSRIKRPRPWVRKHGVATWSNVSHQHHLTWLAEQKTAHLPKQ